MSYLYVNEQGARIGVDGGYITVQMKNDLLRKIPSETLENISLFETRNNIKFLLF